MSFPPPTDKQARIIWTALTGLAIAVILALIAGAIWGLGEALQMLSPVLWPLAVAGVLAYLLDPVVDFFERKGLPRTGSIVCVFAIALVVVAGLFGSVVPQLVNQTRQLVANRQEISKKVQGRVEKWLSHPPDFLQRFIKLPSTPQSQTNTVLDTNLTASVTSTNAVPPTTVSTNAGPLFSYSVDRETIESATTWIAKALPKVGAWIFGQVAKVASWFGVLAALALVPIYTFYLLLEKRGIQSKWTDYLPLTRSGFKDELVFVLKSINEYLIAFFRGQVLVAICDGILYTIGFLLIGLPYAALVGAMATFLTIIPFLGAIVTFVVALIISLVSFGDWQHPLMVVGVFAVVQSLEGAVISPKIMGDRVGLHPLTIIIAVMAGTTLLGGLLGGILAIPLTAALRVIMFRYVWKKREAK